VRRRVERLDPERVLEPGFDAERALEGRVEPGLLVEPWVVAPWLAPWAGIATIGAASAAGWGPPVGGVEPALELAGWAALEPPLDEVEPVLPELVGRAGPPRVDREARRDALLKLSSGQLITAAGQRGRFEPSRRPRVPFPADSCAARGKIRPMTSQPKKGPAKAEPVPDPSPSWRTMPSGIRIFLVYGFLILAVIGLSLRFVVDQAISAPVSPIGVVVMILLAYTIFTLTLVIQRKEAARTLALGLASLTIPAIPLAWLSFVQLGPRIAGTIFVASLSLLLFRGLLAPNVRAWLIEP
jgi:hypothetical protein